MNKTVDATTPADAGPMRVPHNPIRTRRPTDACAQRLRALRRTAARWLLLLALLADLVVAPAWSKQLPFAGSWLLDSLSASALPADAASAAATQAGDDSGAPSPHAPNPIDAASAGSEHADCEAGLLPSSPHAHLRASLGAALPDPAHAARSQRHGPDPRPPTA